MRTMDDLTPAQRAELEALGAADADHFEALDPDDPSVTVTPMPEGFHGSALAWLALRDAERERERVEREAAERVAVAVRRARAGGLSWRVVGEALGMSGENARRTYAKAS